ncbi:MAG: type II toxin-antitoxin system VapC family toxin [Rhodocyclaceae bacterium]
MAIAYLLDTNICIYIAKRRPAGVAAKFARMAPGSVGMSMVTYGELRYGAEKSARRDESLAVLVRLAELIPVLAPEAAAGERYGIVRTELERSGKPIGNNDLWIAAHALALGVVLVTNNSREFERVPGLKVENWADPQE